MMKLHRAYTFGPAVLIVIGCLGAGIAAAAAPQAPTPADDTAKTESAAGKKSPTRAFGRAETLTGTVAMVGGTTKVIVLMGPNGVPYTFVVTPATKISVGGQKASFDMLASQVTRTATVTFVPHANGNVVRSLEIAGT